MKPRVVAIVQARMGSSRLPGKVLLPIAGQPMLGLVVERLASSKALDEIVVATTDRAADDSVEGWCRENDIRAIRGSEFDVLDRYHDAAEKARADVILRITADCPLLDAKLADDVIGALGCENAQDQAVAAVGCVYDFVANRLPPPWPRTYPIGLDAEACHANALDRAWREAREPQQREHVMPFFYEGVQLTRVSPFLRSGRSPRGFRIALLDAGGDYGAYRWTVDTPEDLEFVRRVYELFAPRRNFTWQEILNLVEEQPELRGINAGVAHRSLSDLDDRAFEG